MEQSTDRKIIRQMAEFNLNDMVLGETDTLLCFQTRDELNHLLAAMIQQGNRQVQYFSKKFDEQVIGYSPVPDAIRQFLLNHGESMFKSLVSSSQELVQSGSRLVELLRNNMPRVECRTRRQSSSGHGTFEGCFVTVDNHGYVYLPDPERFAGSACFKAAGTVDKFSEVFAENWRVSDLDAEMQPLYI
ncbi:MAG: hypothetical protein KTR32_30240 [Granulosicoccus sp.]|nr:hypothetical protein [Granulosicoccus sp.]